MSRRMQHILFYGLLALISAVQLGSQSVTAGVTFNAIQARGEDGQLTDHIYRVDASQVRVYLFDFVPDWLVFLVGLPPADILGNGLPGLDDDWPRRYCCGADVRSFAVRARALDSMRPASMLRPSLRRSTA